MVDKFARELAANALKKAGSGGVSKDYVDEKLEEKLDKVGGTVTGDLAISGDLTVSGTTTTETEKQLAVEENVIITNANKVDLKTLLSGLAINKNANATYGIMYDPTDDTVKFGEGTLDKNRKFTFNEGEGLPLAIRADSKDFTDAHLVKWDATKNQFVDAGVGVEDLVQLNEVNRFTSENTFNESVNLLRGLDSDGNLSVTNAVVKIMDNTEEKDHVVQYGADGIKLEENGSYYEYKFPLNSGTIATTENLDGKVGFKYYKLENKDTQTDEIDAITSAELGAQLNISHTDDNSSSGVSVSKDFVSMYYNRPATTEVTAEGASVSVGDTVISLESAETVDGTEKNTQVTINPDGVKVNGNPLITKIQDSSSNEFTPDENGVVTIPASTNRNLGLFTSKSYLGIDVFGTPGYYFTVPANESVIANRGYNNYSTIQGSNLNLAVKAALTDDKRMGTETSGTNTAFTDTEKDRACEIIGAVRQLPSSSANQVYAKNAEGEDTSLTYSYAAEGDTIAKRSAAGTLAVETPTQDKDAANKQYVDTKSADIPVGVQISDVEGSVEGIITDPDFALLTANANNYIIKDGKKYERSSDRSQYDSLTYVYNGYLSNRQLQEAIEITVSSKSWVLNAAKLLTDSTIANGKLGGVSIKSDSSDGLEVSNVDGNLSIYGALDADIKDRNSKRPITTINLNKAVKAALTDANRIGTETTNPTTLTSDEMDTACAVLGAARTTIADMVDGNLLQWDEASKEVVCSPSKTSDFLTLKKPVGVQTDFVQIVRRVDGTISQQSATGVATVGPDNKAVYAPVLRGAQGQLTCHTAPEANQTDYDCVNRGEFKEKAVDLTSAQIITGPKMFNIPVSSVDPGITVKLNEDNPDPGIRIMSSVYDDKVEINALGMRVFGEGSETYTEYNDTGIIKLEAGTIKGIYSFPDKSGTIALLDDVSGGGATAVEITSPASATNGTLTDDQYSTLQASDSNYIKFNNEYYYLADKGHTEGIISYTHNGWNGNANQTKSINITTATKAWSLTVGYNKYYRHYITLTVGDRTIYYDFSSPQATAYTADTLPVQPDTGTSVFVMLSGGYYSNMSGMVYRDGTQALKILLHGIYSPNGTDVSYFTLPGTAVDAVADDVQEM